MTEAFLKILRELGFIPTENGKGDVVNRDFIYSLCRKTLNCVKPSCFIDDRLDSEKKQIDFVNLFSEVIHESIGLCVQADKLFEAKSDALTELHPVMTYMLDAKEMAAAHLEGKHRENRQFPEDLDLNNRLERVRAYSEAMKEAMMLSQSRKGGNNSILNCELDEINKKIQGLRNEIRLMDTEYERCSRRVDELKRIQSEPVEKEVEDELRQLHLDFVKKHQNIQFLRYHNSLNRKSETCSISQAGEHSNEDLIITGDLI